MIIWLSSFPKSGNTYIRSFLSAYYFTNDGEFDFNLLRYIEQFPDKQFFNGFVESKESASKKVASIAKRNGKIKKNQIS